MSVDGVRGGSFERAQWVLARDLPDAKLWRIDLGADYGPLNPAARGEIDLARIRRHWPDIVRLVASIHTGAVSAHDVLRMLAPAGNLTQSGDALAHFARIFKTLHDLTYVRRRACRTCVATSTSTATTPFGCPTSPVAAELWAIATASTKTTDEARDTPEGVVGWRCWR